MADGTTPHAPVELTKMGEAYCAAAEAPRSLPDGLAAFPLPTRQPVRASRLLAGLARLERLQGELAAKLVELMDQAEGDADLEDDEGDGESDLEPACEDEGAQCDDEGVSGSADPDNEWEIGWSEGESVRGYLGTGMGSDEDRDPEPSLGASDNLNQSRWAHGPRDDLEDQCEDEGGACEDEGAVTGDDEPSLNPATGNGSFDARDLEEDRARIEYGQGGVMTSDDGVRYWKPGVGGEIYHLYEDEV